jgi:hypothetical protein
MLAGDAAEIVDEAVGHIAAYLRRGRNVMSVLVTYYAPAWLSASPFQSTVATLPADIR